ncbi:Uncharacterised protein [Mycobacterium tuberculosis]|nr:Uncharacterised protein [Mycobacterium tuberculosis]
MVGAEASSTRKWVRSTDSAALWRVCGSRLASDSSW